MSAAPEIAYLATASPGANTSDVDEKSITGALCLPVNYRLLGLGLNARLDPSEIPLLTVAVAGGPVRDALAW